MSQKVGLLRRARARVERALAPGFGCCYRCRRPWKYADYHTTDYGRGHGCFPLCERCWGELADPDARWPYYRLLLESWAAHSPLTENEPDRIRDAVKAGL